MEPITFPEVNITFANGPNEYDQIALDMLNELLTATREQGRKEERERVLNVVGEAIRLCWYNVNDVGDSTDQPPYRPLPAYKVPEPQGRVISRWRLTWRERFRLLFGGNIWLSMMTFNKPPMPILPSTESPFAAPQTQERT